MYISTRLGMSPPLAALVFDAAAPTSCTPAPGVELRLTGPTDRTDALRSRTGSLRAGRRLARPVPVELELTARSAGGSELALRVVGRRRNPGTGFGEAAAAVVDRLAEELELRALLALHPSHGTGAAEESPSAWL